MSFDLSRVRFDPRQDFFGVVMQQGRVQLDSDWNEWSAELARRIQAGTYDTFTGNVVPRTTPDGFRISADSGNLSIGPGRIYVDGLVAENHGGKPDTWTPQLSELTGTAAIDYGQQPYYPNAPELPEGGPHLVYLDVWQRDITALQVPELIEQAVGVDTTGRLQTVWQVKLLPDVGEVSCSTPDADVPGYAGLTAASAARLSTDTADVPGEISPCEVPPAAGYLGLENQLYRVEVHTGGAQGSATFKWSRDNGTVASRITHLNPARDRITVESIGRDDVLRFNDGDWVEVTDDWLELHNQPGQLRRISVAGGVDASARTLSFDDALPAGLFPVDAQQATDPERNTRVRRWDQTGVVRAEDGAAVQDLNTAGSSGEIAIPPPGTRLLLEHGIVVEFDLDPAGGEFKTGDYWNFAARSTDASIEELDRAPPLGIHHHFTRLAIVDFPESESDCRTLWPPLIDGDSCACTVCVSAEGHNDGSATIQQAIDSIKDTGGTICLGIGNFDISAPLNLVGARSLRLKGQGWASLLIAREPANILTVENSLGVALEDMTIIGSAGSEGETTMIHVHNAVDFHADHINVLGLAENDADSIGIGLSGYCFGVKIYDCGIVATRGISRAGDDDANYLLSAELVIYRNLIFCSQYGVVLDHTSLHYGNTRVDENLILTGSQAAVAVTGAGLDGSATRISNNQIFSEGDGIRAGVGSLSIEANYLTGAGSRSGHGILLTEGLEPGAVDDISIHANNLRSFAGDALGITHAFKNLTISANKITEIGQAALVMTDNGSADYLAFTDNLCHDIGTSIENSNRALAAIQIIAARRCDITANVIANVATNTIAAPEITGIRVIAAGQLRISRNRLYGIGPERISSPVVAISIQPPFDHLAIESNNVDRAGEIVVNPIPINWKAINIQPSVERSEAFLAPASYFANAESAFLLTATQLLTRRVTPSTVIIRGNHLRAHMTAVTMTQCTSVHSCLFGENHCEVTEQASSEPTIGVIRSYVVNVSNNRLVSIGDVQTMHLHAQSKSAVVIGNTSTGPISVKSGAPVPADISLTNVFGI